MGDQWFGFLYELNTCCGKSKSNVIEIAMSKIYLCCCFESDLASFFWWRIRPHSNPYVSHALGCRLCGGVVIGALREYKVARQSTSMRRIVLLK